MGPAVCRALTSNEIAKLKISDVILPFQVAKESSESRRSDLLKVTQQIRSRAWARVWLLTQHRSLSVPPSPSLSLFVPLSLPLFFFFSLSLSLSFRLPILSLLSPSLCLSWSHSCSVNRPKAWGSQMGPGWGGAAGPGGLERPLAGGSPLGPGRPHTVPLFIIK